MRTLNFLLCSIMMLTGAISAMHRMVPMVAQARIAAIGGVCAMPSIRHNSSFFGYSNPYEVLGVAKDASLIEIKKRYQALALTMHPDAGGTHEMFVQLNDAWEKIKEEKLLVNARLHDQYNAAANNDDDFRERERKADCRNAYYYEENFYQDGQYGYQDWQYGFRAWRNKDEEAFLVWWQQATHQDKDKFLIEMFRVLKDKLSFQQKLKLMGMMTVVISVPAFCAYKIIQSVCFVAAGVYRCATTSSEEIIEDESSVKITMFEDFVGQNFSEIRK